MNHWTENKINEKIRDELGVKPVLTQIRQYKENEENVYK
jgi:hypothetical protein